MWSLVMSVVLCASSLISFSEKMNILLKGIVFVCLAFGCHRLLNVLYWRSKLSLKSDEKVIGFFHPHCDSGGGGERVLWVMIHALLSAKTEYASKIRVVIYAGSYPRVGKESMLKHVSKTFGIDFLKENSSSNDTEDLECMGDRISFVPLRSTRMLEAKWYPVATMLCQLLASVVVGAGKYACIYVCVHMYG